MTWPFNPPQQIKDETPFQDSLITFLQAERMRLFDEELKILTLKNMGSKLIVNKEKMHYISMLQNRILDKDFES